MKGTTQTPDALVRRSTVLVVVAVAVGAAIVSYRHAYELVHSHGETGLTALIVPGTVDGLIYAAGMVLLSAARRRVRPPGLAYVGLWLGITATVGANVAHGWDHGPIGALVSAWPAVALIISYELLMKLVRTGGAAPVEPAEEPAAATVDPCPHGVADTVEDAALNAFVHARDCVGAPLSQRQVADRFGLDRKRLGALVREHDQPPADDGPEATDAGQAVEVAT